MRQALTTLAAADMRARQAPERLPPLQAIAVIGLLSAGLWAGLLALVRITLG